jgi:hypothetical protein
LIDEGHSDVSLPLTEGATARADAAVEIPQYRYVTIVVKLADVDVEP